MANIYEKLQLMRCAFQKENVKKSGKNPFAGYEYFELNDIMPLINKLMKEYQVSSYLNFEPNQAKLTLINTEKPEETIVFTSPMAQATLKGCHEVQNLGASITYLRRYLWVNAFEIVENDVLDATHQKDGANGQKNANLGHSTVAPDTGWNDEDVCLSVCSKCNTSITNAENKYSKEKYGLSLCRKCQSLTKGAK